MEYFTGTKGATEETRHEVPEARQGRIEGDLGPGRMLGTLVRVIRSGNQALDAVMLELGRRVAERIMLNEREALAGPDDYLTHPDLQKGAHEAGSAYIDERPFSRIMLQRELSNLGMHGLQINRRLRQRGFSAKDLGRSLAELPFPLGNLIGMHLKPLRQFGQRLVAAHRGQRHFGFEHR